MEDLSLILWRERELLETLLYRLEVEKLVLASGSSRWLATSAREVEAVLDALRETELVRAVAADEAAAGIGMASNPSLRALAEAVDEPWRSILLDHREAFVTYMQEITAIAAANRELLTTGQMAARETLLGLTDGTSSTYSHDGSAVAHDASRRLVDQSI
jgi:FlgN protein